ncbi:MAG TPA: hypothetical protein PLP25_07855 [Candidatus Limiplasma sp.]|nr:hypothetical protein [Candidatus Limiplasma sp.]HPS81755.1 hypothetical protein [Candidatus Limiplasma sp.]
MFIKQISVFIENTPGRLADFTKVLADNNIDLVSLSIADTTHFGILRGIVADSDKACKVLAEHGYTVKLTDVLAVCVPDRPGGLAAILAKLAEKNVALEYLYSFVRNTGDQALIIMRVDKLEDAVSVLKEAGVKLLSQSEVSAL